MDFQPNRRKEMAYQIYIVAGLLVIPFSIMSMLQGNTSVAILPFITAILSLVNVVSYARKKTFVFPAGILSFLYIISCSLVLPKLGPPGAYWVFPVMLSIFWMHDRRTARYLVGVLFLAVTIVSFSSFSKDVAARLTATLLMTGIFFNVAARIFETQYNDLEKLTVTDYLTGAYNRRYMDEKIDELLARFNRMKSISSIITFDVDNFKRINDNYGHSVGDKVLVEISKNAKLRVRSLDSVCRSGGEEFVILLPDTNEQAAKLLAEELRLSISQLPLVTGSTVTISCGVSAVTENDTRDSWLKRSDKAMYKAKANGRNNVVVSAAEEYFVCTES